MTHQVALTIRAPIKDGEIPALHTVFAKMQQDVEHNDVVPFGDLHGVHFARFVVVPGDNYTRASEGPSLMWVSSADAPVDDHLDDLVSVAGEGLDRVFAHCVGYPAESARTSTSRRAYLESHMIPAQAFYVNTVGRTVEQVRQEADLRDRIGDYIDEQLAGGNWDGADSDQVRSGIIEFVRSDPNLRWALAPAAQPSLMWRVAEMGRFGLIIVAGLLLLPVIVIVAPIGLLLVRMKEIRDAVRSPPPPILGSRTELAAAEDWAAHNQFSAAGSLKPGWVRFVAAHTILRLAGIATRHVFTRNDLGTIPLLGLHGVDTIHFARWVSIDEGRRVVFMSNYDGSLESYMDDFINKVAWGLNAVFSHGRTYPATRWLVFDGAKDEQAFKAFLRRHQLPSEVWFSAYPQLTAANIANNSAIRAGLSERLDSKGIERWLRRL